MIKTAKIQINLPLGLRVCPTCKGTGINPINSLNVCPKCYGETVVGIGLSSQTW